MEKLCQFRMVGHQFGRNLRSLFRPGSIAHRKCFNLPNRFGARSRIRSSERFLTYQWIIERGNKSRPYVQINQIETFLIQEVVKAAIRLLRGSDDVLVFTEDSVGVVPSRSNPKIANRDFLQEFELISRRALLFWRQVVYVRNDMKAGIVQGCATSANDVEGFRLNSAERDRLLLIPIRIDVDAALLLQ